MVRDGGLVQERAGAAVPDRSGSRGDDLLAEGRVAAGVERTVAEVAALPITVVTGQYGHPWADQATQCPPPNRL